MDRYNAVFYAQPGDKKSLLSAHPEVKGQIEQQGNDKGTLLIFHYDGWKNYTPMFAECSYTCPGDFAVADLIHSDVVKTVPDAGNIFLVKNS
jgi:hypothetical protein